MNKPSNLIKSIRYMCTKPTTNGEIKPIMYNRNPRNLERMRLAKKPTGYAMEDQLVEFWHKLCFHKSSRSITAEVIHNTERVVISASTDEWAISKVLYSSVDTQAHIVLARVLAQRCFESGINYVTSDVIYEKGSKVEIFLKELLREGLSLEEPGVFNIQDKWKRIREKRPWTVLENDFP